MKFHLFMLPTIRRRHELEQGMAGLRDDLNLGRTVKGTGIAPKFSETPGKIWRGSVPVGHDNEMVFRQLLGITSEDLAKLVEDGVV